MKRIFAALLPLMIGATLFAQTLKLPERAPNSVYFCDDEINEELLRLNPHLIEDAKQADALLEQAYQQKLHDLMHKRLNANEPKYVISVVWHVVHANGPENISDEQIRDCMRVMNEDFNKLNADTTDVVSSFQDRIGNANIEFRLALKDPNGNPTNGINRYFSPNLTNNGGENSKINQWDRSKYLNIWVVADIASGAAAYTYRPSSVNSNFAKSADGIITLHNYVGSIGTGNYTRSRTLTHEIGHWLNLPHTWGNGNTPAVSTNCNQDDGVSDTPNTEGWTSCNLNGITCGSLDNVQNYMDYSYCSRMFTKGQSTRMRVALESIIAERRTLWQPATLAATGVDKLLAIDFEVENPIVCFGSPVQFTDASFYNQDTWNWTFNGANTSTSGSQNPLVTFVQPGIHNVSLTVSNNSNSLTLNRPNFIWALPEVGYAVPYQNSFENPNNFTEDVYIINHDTDQVKFEKVNNAAFDGSNSMFLRNAVNSFFNIDEFIVGPVDVSPLQQIDLTWKIAYAQKNGSEGDILRVLVSPDCGKTWRQKYLKSGSALATAPNISSEFTPSALNDWREEGVSNFNSVERNTEVLLIKFQFESDGGNNIFIDDVKISGNYNPVPVQEYPRNNELNVSASPLINWKAVGNVTSYEYQVDINTNFNTSNLVTGIKSYIDLSPNNSDTEEQLSGLLFNTKYFWRVRSITNNVPSAWSPIWSFTVSENGVGMQEKSTSKKSLVFPNPNNGSFQVVFAESIPREIQLFDITGKVWFTRFTSDIQMEISDKNLPKGVYFLRASSNQKSEIIKVVIQ